MRWIGWVVVVVALAAMTFARLTDDKERRGRELLVAPIVREPSGSGAAPADGEDAGARRAETDSESL